MANNVLVNGTPTTLFFEEIFEDGSRDADDDQQFTFTNLQASSGGGGGGGSIVLLNNRLYLFGGCGRSGTCSSALHCFDVDTSSWVDLPNSTSSSPTSSPSPQPRYGHSLISFGNSLILFGGQSPPSSSTPSASYNDLHAYDIQTNAWSCIDYGTSEDESAAEYYSQAVRPMPRNSHSAVVTTDGRTMIVFGGANAEVGPMNDVWTLDLSSILDGIDVGGGEGGEQQPVQWERIVGGNGSDGSDGNDEDDGNATPWPEAREMHSACIVPLSSPDKDGTNNLGMLVMGGRKVDGTAFQDLWLFDLQTRQWRELSDTRPERPRCSHTSVYLPNDSVVVFFGGWDCAGTIFGDLTCFDLTSESWIDVASTAIQGDHVPERFAHAACEDGTGGGLYILGGVNAQSDLQDLVYVVLGTCRK